MTIIPKSPDQKKSSQLPDDETFRSTFDWDQARSQLLGLPGNGINIAYEAIDRHVESGNNGDKLAIRFCQQDGTTSDYTYADLKLQTNKFANALGTLGLAKGDGFFALSPRVPELYIGVLGALKHRMVFSPLFAAFGPEPIRTRMEMGKGKVLLTTAALYKRKVKKIRDQLVDLKHVVLVGPPDPTLADEPGVVTFTELMEKADTYYQIGHTAPEDRALLHFTSGTTGKPKGAIHVHNAVVAHHITGQFALDLKPDDIYWCTADPGWVTGTSYGIIAPLTNGVTMIVDAGEFDAERWYKILEEQKVNVWYTAPTAIRMMMKMGKELLSARNLSRLRFIASVGEPLNPEAIKWGMEAFHLPIHDNWWQTETGGIMIANCMSTDIKPGSMGRPLPGIEAAILSLKDGKYQKAGVGEEGELALKTPWPSMFRGYLGQDERYQKAFTPEGWYLSGDLAKQDDDGYFWFVGRADDVIKSAGHLIGPFEVESALLEHPAVAEAAVIGKPDKVLMEVVKAYITLNKGYSPSDKLTRDIVGSARKKLGPAVAPRELEIKDSLPKTRSGKIMRRLLKARELGLPEGDTSTLEADPTVAK